MVTNNPSHPSVLQQGDLCLTLGWNVENPEVRVVAWSGRPGHEDPRLMEKLMVPWLRIITMALVLEQ